MIDLDSLPTRYDAATPTCKRILIGHSPNGVYVDSEQGAFYFHKKIGGHGQGVVTRLWEGGPEPVLEVISTDCCSHADAFAIVDEHLEEMAVLLEDARAEFGL
jgi:hypothetical protein